MRHGQALPLNQEASGPRSRPCSAAGLLSISWTRYFCRNADNSEPDIIRTCNKLLRPTHHVQSPGFPDLRGITAHLQPGVHGGINQPASSQGSEPPLNRSPKGPETLAQVALALSLMHRRTVLSSCSALNVPLNAGWRRRGTVCGLSNPPSCSPALPGSLRILGKRPGSPHPAQRASQY